MRIGARWRVAAETELRPTFRPANYDAWETNDFFTSDDRMAVFSLALYKCLSACKSKGRNSATSRTNLSLPLPISVNATVSIFSFFLNSYRLTSSVVCPSSIIVFAYVLSPKLMFRWACHFLWVKKVGAAAGKRPDRERNNKSTADWVVKSSQKGSADFSSRAWRASLIEAGNAKHS
jgi:hypothetical protein